MHAFPVWRAHARSDYTPRGPQPIPPLRRALTSRLRSTIGTPGGSWISGSTIVGVRAQDELDERWNIGSKWAEAETRSMRATRAFIIKCI